MPHDALHVLDCPFPLGKCRDRAPDDLERELRQAELKRQFVQDPFAIVVRVHERSAPARKDKRFRVRWRRPCFFFFSFFLSYSAWLTSRQATRSWDSSI